MAETTVVERTAVVLRGRRLEYFTIAWNALEGLVAVVAGAIAGSISLVGFGIDSFTQSMVGRPSCGTHHGSHHRERRNRRIAGKSLRRMLHIVS